MTMGERSSRCPFTASQAQELEHQTLIFKYMATGIPIPHNLILLIRDLYPEHCTHLFPHQSSIGPGCYQMGIGREDPEPWRCRRTDGKKWRCSKEAYLDSKYCERHMHRGKKRSRKHVEASTGTTSTAATAGATSYSSTTTFTISPKPYLFPRHRPMAAASEAYQRRYPVSSASRDSAATGFPPRSSTPRFNLLQEMATSLADKDYRYGGGWKEDLDHYTFFPHSSRAEKDEPWRLAPLGMSSPGEPAGRKSFSFLQQKGSYFTADDLPREEESKKNQHCFVLGGDFKLESPAKAEAEAEAEEEGSEQPLGRFFNDWPPKSKEPWTGQEEEAMWGPCLGTQLCISIPMPHQDSPVAGFHSWNDT